MRKNWLMILILIVAVALAACGQETTLNPEYAEYYARDCQKLEEISSNGMEAVNQDWVAEELFHYQVQPDGHGLATVMHPQGMDASGTTYSVMYETSDGGKNWNVLHEMFGFTRGADAFVYMGEVVVLAADQSKGSFGTLVISYDRGRTWSDEMYLHELFSYDNERFENIKPHVINYNEHTGIITFGWSEDYAPGNYLLINQFDVGACAFLEEVYRHPDFPTAP